jgi:hypothetical protein
MIEQEIWYPCCALPGTAASLLVIHLAAQPAFVFDAAGELHNGSFPISPAGKFDVLRPCHSTIRLSSVSGKLAHLAGKAHCTIGKRYLGLADAVGME